MAGAAEGLGWPPQCYRGSHRFPRASSGHGELSKLAPRCGMVSWALHPGVLACHREARTILHLRARLQLAEPGSKLACLGYVEGILGGPRLERGGISRLSLKAVRRECKVQYDGRLQFFQVETAEAFNQFRREVGAVARRMCPAASTSHGKLRAPHTMALNFRWFVRAEAGHQDDRCRGAPLHCGS